jgi:hypothetical protein
MNRGRLGITPLGMAPLVSNEELFEFKRDQVEFNQSIHVKFEIVERSMNHMQVFFLFFM